MQDKVDKVGGKNGFLLFCVALRKKDLQTFLHPNKYFGFSSKSLLMHAAKMNFSWAKDSSAKNLFEKSFQKYPIGSFQKGTFQKVPMRKSKLLPRATGAQS